MNKRIVMLDVIVNAKGQARTKNEKRDAFCEIDPVELPVWCDVIPG